VFIFIIIAMQVLHTVIEGPKSNHL